MEFGGVMIGADYDPADAMSSPAKSCIYWQSARGQHSKLIYTKRLCLTIATRRRLRWYATYHSLTSDRFLRAFENALHGTASQLAVSYSVDFLIEGRA